MSLLPEPDSDGCRLAIESVRAIMAQQLIVNRQKVGLSQVELVSRASLRQETISHIEADKTTPTVRAMEAIDGALEILLVEHGVFNQ